ncbi:MAG TPA: hypothetical protein VG425_17335 [Casimicrobiaceae bacterium]|jgi:hypothetical protein|nr:hypothetical protein [Casimicrobiaceae bacterium]
MPENPLRASAAPSLPTRQRGVVLFIALIVMVVMSLAALGLMRSVDTTTAVLGNLALRQASILPANYAIEEAASGLFADAGGPRIPDLNTDWAAENYFAEHDYNQDAPNGGAPSGVPDGVPKQLWTQLAAQGLPKQSAVDADNNHITYLTERMCVKGAAGDPGTGIAKETWCDMGQPKPAPGTTVNQANPLSFPQQVFYRVTIRVDGPQNTVSFLQAMLR